MDQDPPRPSRKYQSTRRTEQARETRLRILAAALRVFTASGYAGAAVETIAQEAGVSPLTVYAIFKNKRTLLSELVNLNVGGDDRPTPLLERPEQRAVLEETDPPRQVGGFAVGISNILERVWPLFEIMRAAAKTEPEIAALLQASLDRRLHNLGVFVSRLAANGGLRPDLDQALATETVWSIASPELYRLLTVDRGWSKDQFTRWLADTLTCVLLPTSGHSSAQE